MYNLYIYFLLWCVMCSNICSLLCALVVVCRTKYKMLNRLRSNLPGIPFVALTATATERSKNHFFLSHLGYWHCVLIRVRGDIHESLVLHNPFIYIGSFDRPNLFYGVKLIKPRSSKLQTILEMLRDVPCRVESRESTIIYCVTIKDTQQASRIIWSCFSMSCHNTFRQCLFPNTTCMSQFEIRYMKLFLDYVLMLPYTMARWAMLQEQNHTSWFKYSWTNTFLAFLSLHLSNTKNILNFNVLIVFPFAFSVMSVSSTVAV
jgi:hypothetical protein